MADLYVPDKFMKNLTQFDNHNLSNKSLATLNATEQFGCWYGYSGPYPNYITKNIQGLFKGGWLLLRTGVVAFTTCHSQYFKLILYNIRVQQSRKWQARIFA